MSKPKTNPSARELRAIAEARINEMQNEQRQAPALHKNKVDAKVLRCMERAFYWRYWNARTR